MTTKKKPQKTKSTPKKTVGKKTAGKKSPAKTSSGKGKSLMQNTTKVFISLFFFLFLLIGLIFIVTRISIPEFKVKSALGNNRAEKFEPTVKPVYRATKTPPPQPFHPEEKQDEPIPQQNKGVSRGAIIIDDLGQDMMIARQLIELDIPLAIAVLPDLPYSKQIAELAHNKGKVVMAHLPMQAMSKENMTEGLPWLKTSMSRVKIEEILEGIFTQNPYALGANNHTGSLFTTNRQAMGYVLDYLKKHGLFFIDSRTTSRTIAFAEAKAKGILSCERNVFFDDNHDPSFIRKEFIRFMHYGETHGTVVGIGHPRAETLQVLKEFIPKFNEDNILLVRITDLLNSGSEEMKLALKTR